MPAGAAEKSLEQALLDASEVTGPQPQAASPEAMQQAVDRLNEIARELSAANYVNQAWEKVRGPQLDVAQRTALTASRFAEQTAGNSLPSPASGETPMAGGSMFRSAAVAEGKGRTEQEGGTRAGDALGDAPPDPLLGAGGERLEAQLKQAGLSGPEAEGKDNDAWFYAESREQKALAGWRSVQARARFAEAQAGEQRRHFHPASSDRKGLLHESPRGQPMNTATVDRQVQQFRDNFRVVREEVSRVIVGNDDNIVGIMTCLLARGHVLLEGIPGIGKTKLVQTLADVLHLKFARIQFTPDLMPGDIIGTTIVREDDAGRKHLVFQRGPIFANLVLADEINRATPKTQSALLEAMQENSVSAGGQTHPLEQPFFVLATMNPLEMEGTYPLPEAQLDRFFFKLRLGFPTARRAARDHRSHHQAAGAARRPRAGPGRGAGDARDRAQRAGCAARAAVRHRPDAGHAPGERGRDRRWSSASCASAPARAAPRR